MASISIFDSVSFSVRDDERLACHCVAPGLQLDKAQIQVLNSQSNLAWRAAEAVRQTMHDVPRAEGSREPGLAAEPRRKLAGGQLGADIRIVKRIPLQAGLGGASSNAAAVLLLANRLWQAGLNRKQLHAIAAELGSDVPFFLDGRLSLCRGRGEKLTPQPSKNQPFVVVCKPRFGLSTKEVYGNLGTIDQPIPALRFLADWNSGNYRSAMEQTVNRLQEPAEKLSNEIRAIFAVFNQLNSLGHLMSGSGSSCFGIFRSWKNARIAAQQVQSRIPESRVFFGRLQGSRWHSMG